MNNVTGTKIIICGLNGAGKSTLGRALAEKTGWVFKDVEDYYFPKNDPSYPYATQRTEEEIVKLLYNDLLFHSDILKRQAAFRLLNPLRPQSFRIS